MHWLSSGDIVAEATDGTGANVSFAVDPGTTCDPAPASHFALDTTTPVSCTDDSDPSIVVNSFTVTVVDTTAPTLTGPPGPISMEATSPAGATVTFATPTASDIVDGSVTVTCSPASGDTVSLGSHTATCTATDTHGYSASNSFGITVTDTTKPVLSGTPGSVSVEATSPSGTVVTYTPPTATDNADASPTVTCSPASGSTFPLGATPVSCSAQDDNGNTSDSDGFTVTVLDTTNPVIVGLPSSFSVEATSASGASASYTAPAATDNADSSPTVGCVPASGSTFGLGPQTVTCTAHDDSGHNAVGTFTVTVTDTTGPTFSSVSTQTVEANGPAGSNVNYPTPTAIDAVDGPVAIVPCAPAPGTKFALGTTVVNCSATDDHSNTSHATFNVTVSDKTPPTLIVPAARSVYATTPTGVPNTVSGVVSFLSAASATDIVDGSPVITNNAPSFLPVGNLTITFGARDFSGNVTYKSVNLIVLPQPPPGTPPLVIPPKPTIPAQPTNVKITPLDGAVRIQWNAGGREVMVTRSSSANRSFSAVGDERVVYTGNGTSYTDRGLKNGVEYRYVVMAVDAAGNHSVGVAGVVVPRRNLLKSPKDGARLRKAPKLIWARDAEAQYYNAQLLLNGKKILSVWPVRPTYALKKSWKYLGHKYTLKPGLYSWYIFPGYGARSAVHYGNLMGSRTFRILP